MHFFFIAELEERTDATFVSIKKKLTADEWCHVLKK